MELVLESKLTETLVDSTQNNSNYFSVYSLKINKAQSTESSNVAHQISEQNSTINKDFSLSLVTNNLPSVNEARLRECFAKKIEKGTFYASANGNISTFDLGFNNKKGNDDDDNSQNSICYHNYFQQTGQQADGCLGSHYLICFILTDEASNLDLFRNEVDFYCERNLKKFFNEKAVEFLIDDELNSLLTDWFSNSIGYLHRVIELFKENISVLIEEAFSCCPIDFENLSAGDQNDIKLFCKSFDCSQFIRNPSLELEKPSENVNCEDIGDSDAKLKIKCSTDKSEIEFSKTVNSQFSSECAQVIMDDYNLKKNLFNTKQIIEILKLKFIHDLNKFNRYLTKGKSHYYDLFKAVLHLKYSKNSEILIKIFKNVELSGSMKSFDVVVDFYNNINLSDDEGLARPEPKQNNSEQSKSMLSRFAQKFPVH